MVEKRTFTTRPNSLAELYLAEFATGRDQRDLHTKMYRTSVITREIQPYQYYGIYQ